MKQQDDKKQRIIYEGLKALCLKGYNATGVKEITDAANIPKGSFYNYFKSKEHFVLEAMEYFTAKELVFMNELLKDTSLSPLTRIENLYKVKIEHFAQRGSFSLGCFLCNMTLEMADVSQPIAKTASQMFQREDEPVVSCLKEAQESGELDAARDIYELSGLIRDSWLGALIIMKANKSADPLYSFLKNLRNLILK